MKIAISYQSGQIFQHFGHTESFKIYEVKNDEIVNMAVVPTMGEGHGALADFLAKNGVDVLICGGIGAGAKNALGEKGIKIYAGCSGDADNAVIAFLNGKLDYDPDVHCDHHDNEHAEGHNCGEHGCKH